MIYAESKIQSYSVSDFFSFAGYLDHFATLDPQLVDLGLGNVSSLLSLLHFMLHLPEPGQVSVGLLLLCDQTTVKSNPFGQILRHGVC